MRRALVALSAFVLVGLVALVVVVEVGGRRLVETAAEEELARQGLPDATVQVGRSWWRPAILPAVLVGELDRLHVTLRDSQVSGVDVRQADYELRGLQVRLSVGDRTVEITGIEDGGFLLVVDPSSFASVLGVDAVVVDGELLVGPDRAPATLAVDGDDLLVDSELLRSQGIDGRVPVLDAELLPCEPAVSLLEDTVVLSCRGDRLPGVLAAPFGPTDPTEADPSAVPPALQPSATLDRDATTTASTTTVPTTAGGDDAGG